MNILIFGSVPKGGRGGGGWCNFYVNHFEYLRKNLAEKPFNVSLTEFKIKILSIDAKIMLNYVDGSFGVKHFKVEGSP